MRAEAAFSVMHGHVLGSRAANHQAISQIPLETISEKSLGLIMLIYIAVKLPPQHGNCRVAFSGLRNTGGQAADQNGPIWLENL